MYELVQEPQGEESARAFDALDEAFGTEQFAEAEANKVLAESGFGSGMFKSLVASGSVSEAD
jgi:hypothetical protein